MMTARETLYARAVQDVYDKLTVQEDHKIARAVMAVADDELAAVTKDRDIYKDAFKDAAMANTVSARKLAEQEAKTVEYRAAWIKAQRERDHYRTLLLDERRASGLCTPYCDLPCSPGCEKRVTE